jgi:hypothetical protein
VRVLFVFDTRRTADYELRFDDFATIDRDNPELTDDLPRAL